MPDRPVLTATERYRAELEALCAALDRLYRRQPGLSWMMDGRTVHAEILAADWDACCAAFHAAKALLCDTESETAPPAPEAGGEAAR